MTLVWTDPPASVGSTSALIHDLDLVVIAQSTGDVYYPNGLDEEDSVNNVEKVVISDTTEGETYTISVRSGVAAFARGLRAFSTAMLPDKILLEGLLLGG